jgi:hypothetical protein
MKRARSEGRIKKFLKGLFVKLDQKMEEKAKSGSCCCKPQDRGDKSCCS